MAEEKSLGLVEAIFENKKNLNDKYPYSAEVKYFDLHRKHFLYGKIDRSGDAIMIQETNLSAIRAGKKSTNFAADFVSDAFSDFREYYRSKIWSQVLDKNSYFGNDLAVRKGWLQGSIGYSYHHYTNKLYSDFTNVYLKTDRRHEKIVNFDSFLIEFMRYICINAYYFPFTRTGYILSHHSSPFMSGLTFEIAPGSHSVGRDADILKYVNDPNFFSGWIPDASKKFGFMVDINAPWRLVFNVASSASEPRYGGAKYLSKRGVNFENVFDVYYTKSHLTDFQNLKSLLLQFYKAYYMANRTSERLEYVTPSNGGDCYTKKITLKRSDRSPPPPTQTIGKGPLDTPEYDEYFLKALLKLRLIESRHPDINKNLKSLTKELLDTSRALGIIAALNYINNLTKGAPVSKFLRKGKFWYGMDKAKYNNIKREVQQSLASSLSPDHDLTGTKGKV